MTPAQRKAAQRARLREEGGRMIELALSPAAAQALARLREREGFASDAEAIAHALEQASAAAPLRTRRPRASRRPNGAA